MANRDSLRSRWMMRLFPVREMPEQFVVALFGVFLLFMPIGFQFELLREQDASLPRGISGAAFTGAIACAWFVLGRFKMWWFMPAWLVIQLLMGAEMGRLDRDGRLAWDISLSHRWTMNLLTLSSMATLGLGFGILIRVMIRASRRSQSARAELEVARRVHESIVPPIDVRVPGMRVFASSRASSSMGGDLIDVVRREGEIDVFVADVSGHGVKAGIVMAMLKSAVRTRLASGGSLGLILADVNRALADLTDPSMFATLACVRIRPGEARDAPVSVEHALAGHLPILHIGPDGSLGELENHCLPLGIELDEQYVTGRTIARPGDVLVFATDGLVEVRAPDGREFGLSAFREAARSLAGRGVEDMHREIMARVDAHGPQLDDQTLAIVQFL